ncbi:MAG: hypothetical protein FD127_2943 [Acidimicrobiaceae bacterium]|nr:MAG: hypothetical protein FD127_2943 [Acidimicrobiaceae bacterium]
MTGGLSELAIGGGDVEQVVDDLEHHSEGVAVGGERVDQPAVEAGDDAADARRGGEQRRRLAGDRGHVRRLGSCRVVGVSQLFDLSFAEPADGARQQGRHLGAERSGDLRRARQQEVAGEDGLQVAPLGVHRLDAAASGCLVHHVVVVQRTGLDELAGDAPLDGVVGGRAAGHLCRRQGEHGAQQLAAGRDEM